jgi:2-alkyl-3-oxoalkanoate reductase
MTPMDPLNVITGATGLIGSHVAELLRSRGERVRALVRPESDTRFLRLIGVETAVGDLADPASLRAAFGGAATVYHCAARVGDWGPWKLYRETVLDATRNVLDACQNCDVGRILHVSSINVYGHPRLRPDEWLDEDDPIGRDLWWWDHYCRAKILAEGLVGQHPGGWTIVRPSWTYGPRDRNTMPRVLEAVMAGRVAMIGRGDNPLNIVHAADIADGVVRAATTPAAVGRVYNLASEGLISQRELLDALTSTLGAPPVRRRVPIRLAMAGGFLSELIGRALHMRRPPRLTRYAVALLSRTTRFRVDRARDQLGWKPHIHPLEGLRQVLAWYRDEAPLLDSLVPTPEPHPARS